MYNPHNGQSLDTISYISIANSPLSDAMNNPTTTSTDSGENWNGRKLCKWDENNAMMQLPLCEHMVRVWTFHMIYYRNLNRQQGTLWRPSTGCWLIYRMWTTANKTLKSPGATDGLTVSRQGDVEQPEWGTHATQWVIEATIPCLIPSMQRPSDFCIWPTRIGWWHIDMTTPDSTLWRTSGRWLPQIIMTDQSLQQEMADLSYNTQWWTSGFWLPQIITTTSHWMQETADSLNCRMDAWVSTLRLTGEGLVQTDWFQFCLRWRLAMLSLYSKRILTKVSTVSLWPNSTVAKQQHDSNICIAVHTILTRSRSRRL